MADTPNRSTSPSRASTPLTNAARFTSQTQDAEDVLKGQTVGLVHFSDFRKRRAEALEGVSRDGTPGVSGSGATTPDGRESSATPVAFKKRKKAVKKGGLSFGNDEEEDGDSTTAQRGTPSNGASDSATPTADDSDAPLAIKKRGLKANANVAVQPQALTKSALAREAQLKESLRREYLQIQEAVKATEFCIPFVFFDGKDAPGGVCRMKKGDFVWLFLDRARKVGAGGSGTRKDWARIGVDDLMLVKGEVIIPHHYDFHYFILNQTTAYQSTPLFPYSASPTSATPRDLLPNKDPHADSASDTQNIAGLMTAADRKAAAAAASATQTVPEDSELEGFHDEPSLTKVVDRRWYERNKHIFPASVWEEFDAKKDYSQGPRKDVLGNAYFFSR